MPTTVTRWCHPRTAIERRGADRVFSALWRPQDLAAQRVHVPGVPEIGRVGNTKHPDGSPSAFLDRHGNLWHSDTASDTHPDGVSDAVLRENADVAATHCCQFRERVRDTA